VILGTSSTLGAICFTGSKPHNIAVGLLGLKRGLTINEYGVFKGTSRIGGRTEEEVFEAIGLPWIPPELREDRGELEAARAHRLPTLVTLTDIRGDLQMHTNATDGQNTLAEMAGACRARGYEYIAITDHTQAARVAGGLTAGGFRRQARAIDALRKRVSSPVSSARTPIDSRSWMACDTAWIKRGGVGARPATWPIHIHLPS